MMGWGVGGGKGRRGWWSKSIDRAVIAVAIFMKLTNDSYDYCSFHFNIAECVWELAIFADDFS